MNTGQLLKWGFWGLLGYSLLKALSSAQQQTNNVKDHGLDSHILGSDLDLLGSSRLRGFASPESLPPWLIQQNAVRLTRQPSQPTLDSLVNPDIGRTIGEPLEQSFRQAFSKVFEKPALLESQLQPVKLAPEPQTGEATNWLKLVHHPSVILILGGRGKGKSALGYRLLEHLRWTASAYVVGLPDNARKVLPEWVGMAANLDDISPKAIVLIDEAYMPFHARSSMAARAKAMSQMVNLSRQREQTLIFVSQESRQIDRNIASSANGGRFRHTPTEV